MRDRHLAFLQAVDGEREEAAVGVHADVHQRDLGLHGDHADQAAGQGHPVWVLSDLEGGEREELAAAPSPLRGEDVLLHLGHPLDLDPALGADQGRQLRQLVDDLPDFVPSLQLRLHPLAVIESFQGLEVPLQVLAHHAVVELQVHAAGPVAVDLHGVLVGLQGLVHELVPLLGTVRGEREHEIGVAQDVPAVAVLNVEGDGRLCV